MPNEIVPPVIWCRTGLHKIGADPTCQHCRICPWCADPGAEDTTPGVPEQLCRPHLAEHDGVSLAELNRMDAEQYAEWHDAVFG